MPAREELMAKSAKSTKKSPARKLAQAEEKIGNAAGKLADAIEKMARKAAAGEPIGKVSVRVTRRKTGKKAPRTKVVVAVAPPRKNRKKKS
jgi:hypothetical protein